VVCKIINLEHKVKIGQNVDKLKQMIQREIDMMTLFDHVNVIRCLHSETHLYKTFIFSEFYNGGNLEDLVN